MCTGGNFGADEILYFDGGLFADSDVIELTVDEIEVLRKVNEFGWDNVEPSIFGTLFERTLNPTKRGQIGAHYTSQADIRTLLEPVMMVPLRREWEEVKGRFEKLHKTSRRKSGVTSKQAVAPKDEPRRRRPSRTSGCYLISETPLAHVRVLDPACGSGNFLYVAINLLLDLQKEVITYGANHEVSLLPQVEPTQLAGLEIDPYAQQLPRWSSGSATCNGCGTTVSSHPRIRCSNRSRASGTRTPFWTCPIPTIRVNPSGPTRISSSETRRFWGTRNSDQSLATSMLRSSLLFIRVLFPMVQTSAAIGLKRVAVK